jgi:predicted enzyme related to lactoylglutathione lyase
VLRARTSIGEHGFVGHFEDSEGNRAAVCTAATAENDWRL